MGKAGEGSEIIMLKFLPKKTNFCRFKRHGVFCLFKGRNIKFNHYNRLVNNEKRNRCTGNWARCGC